MSTSTRSRFGSAPGMRHVNDGANPGRTLPSTAAARAGPLLWASKIVRQAFRVAHGRSHPWGAEPADSYALAECLRRRGFWTLVVSDETGVGCNWRRVQLSVRCVACLACRTS